MPVETTPAPAKSPAAEESAFLGLATVQRLDNGHYRVRLRWGYILGALAGLGVVAWLLGGVALYFYFKVHRQYDEVRFVDMLILPLRYQEVMHNLGEYNLKLADEKFDDHDYREALLSYSIALAKLPDNLHARLRVAQLLGMWGTQELDHSLDVLDSGVPYAMDDPDYLNTYLQLLTQWYRDAKAITVAQNILAKDPKNVKTRTVVALDLAYFLTLRGRYDEADATIAKYHLDDHIEGTLLSAQILWERGKRRDAVAYLDKVQKQYPNNDLVFAALAKYYRDLGDLDAAERYTVLRELAQPFNWTPRIEFLYILAKSGKKAEVNTNAAKYVQQFGSDPNALLALANFATDQGNVALAEQLYEIAVENHAGNDRFDLTAFSLLLIEAHLTVNDFSGALTFISDLNNQHPTWLKQNKPLLDSLTAVAYYGEGRHDLSTVFLTNLLKESFPRPEMLVAVSNRYQSLGAYNEAQQLLQAALKSDPFNQTALVQIVNVDLALGSSKDMATNLRRVMNMRRPPLELVMDAYRELGSDRFIFVPDREKLLEELNRFILDAAARRQAVES